MPRPTPHSSFTVSSGAICFGDLHNIWDGAGASLQPFREDPPDPLIGGTVRVQPTEFNTPAQDGEWRVYELRTPQGTTGWFAAHEDVDPDAEVRRIVRVSGNPSDIDPGSSYNDATTARHGVFVLNRYDWGYYDQRSFDAVDVPEMPEPAWGSGVGVVDRGEARAIVDEWRTQASSQRPATGGGVWLHVVGGEYDFGRIGYDDAHAAARSFLYFNSYTEFTETTFASGGEALKKAETDEERFERRLREDYDFGGIAWLRKALPPAVRDPHIIYSCQEPPPRAEWLGPYAQTDYILTPTDMAAVLTNPSFMPTRNTRLSADAAQLFEAWSARLRDLTNELLMSWLQRIAPALARTDAAEALYPGPVRSGLAQLAYRYFMGQGVDTPALDLAGVGGRIKSFLQRLSPNTSFEDESISGITRVVEYLLAEVFELANNCSRDGQEPRIMPQHVRMVVYPDADLYDCFKYSKVFWEGRGEPAE